MALKQKKGTRKLARKGTRKLSPQAEEEVQKDLHRIAHMFSDFREDPVMREVCRLAIKCAQERLIRGG